MAVAAYVSLDGGDGAVGICGYRVERVFVGRTHVAGDARAVSAGVVVVGNANAAVGVVTVAGVSTVREVITGFALQRSGC